MLVIFCQKRFDFAYIEGGVSVDPLLNDTQLGSASFEFDHYGCMGVACWGVARSNEDPTR